MGLAKLGDKFVHGIGLEDLVVCLILSCQATPVQFADFQEILTLVVLWLTSLEVVNGATAFFWATAAPEISSKGAFSS